MAESNVLSGLVAKRGELAGEVEHYRRELQRLAEALGHVDATIRLFDPSYELGAPPLAATGQKPVPLHHPALGTDHLLALAPAQLPEQLNCRLIAEGKDFPHR